MKTTVVIDDELLRKAVKAAGVKTKREAIELGLRQIVRQKNLDSFRKELGTFDFDLTTDELERMRSDS